ncbi:DUF2889 domain-containing protein [Janibacter sp. G1551]|uniref:DUF2889 domain-containing protein n=1 Tax=Janibacter sp. G1551 TaxID=3420440 RepID=UPI003CFCC7AB
MTPDGAVRVLGTAALSCRVDAAGVLHPGPGAAGASLPPWLVGVPARHGLRRLLAEHYPQPERLSALDAVLLDDLPGLQIISGYAQLHEYAARQDLAPPGRLMVNTCAGFAAGGAAVSGDEPLPDMLAGRPAAPDSLGGGALTWHVEPSPARGGMRRRRMVEVASGDGPARLVRAWFRDSHTDDAGAEVIVHEYELRATIEEGATGLVVRDLEARPRVLPLPDCQNAVVEVLRLSDVALRDIDGAVRRELAGTRGCTHLNDLVRALRVVPRLIDPPWEGQPGPTRTTKEKTP